MSPIPPRIIAHIMAERPLSPERVADLRARLSRDFEAQGRSLVELLIDLGPPRSDAAEHESLQRVARGDADGVMLMRIPMSIAEKKSRDVLFTHLDGPLRFLNAAELAELGLLPGGSKYAPPRTLIDAARLARMLRAAGLSLRAIASRLDAEGFATARGGTWHAATVAQLLDHDEKHSLPDSAADAPAP